MFSVSFVVPSWHYWADPFKLQPLWELYYATVCQAHFPNGDVSVSIEDLRGNGSDSLADAVGELPERDMYAYWIMETGDSVEIQSIVDLLKAQFPRAIHVAGGTHVDMLSEECAEIFDAVIVGPGENSFKQIIDQARSGSLQKVYQQDF